MRYANAAANTGNFNCSGRNSHNLQHSLIHHPNDFNSSFRNRTILPNNARVVKTVPKSCRRMDNRATAKFCHRIAHRLILEDFVHGFAAAPRCLLHITLSIPSAGNFKLSSLFATAYRHIRTLASESPHFL